MGIVALCDITQDCVMLDIGGTTTDIAIFADGVPLIEKDGISLQSISHAGAGPQDALHRHRRRFGHTRRARRACPWARTGRGPAMAAGGKEPALVDALNCRGVI